MITEVSRRLLLCLAALLALGGALVAANRYIPGFIFSDPLNTMIIGAIGGFVSIQRRLKHLPDEDLILMQKSWIYTVLAPLIGSILALALYILFISQLLSGDPFPKFQLDSNVKNQNSLYVFFDTHCTYQDYAKLVFWCFLAGYSEHFVIDIIGQFDKKAPR